MVANDVFSGEMELDFPGALTLALALPTLWAVAKSVNRIREGRRPTPVQREDKTFWEVRCVVVGLASVALSQLVETTDALLSRPARTHARRSPRQNGRGCAVGWSAAGRAECRLALWRRRAAGVGATATARTSETSAGDGGAGGSGVSE